MRINQYIAAAGITSRRKADDMIEEGRVKVNGKVLTVQGYHVEDGDIIEVDGVRIEPEQKKVYYLLNKPAGYVTSTADNEGRPVVTDLVPDDIRVFPVGRLDFNTTGLLILTNDGDLSNKLMHPSHGFDKKYLVRANGIVTFAEAKQLEEEVSLDGLHVLITEDVELNAEILTDLLETYVDWQSLTKLLIRNLRTLGPSRSDSWSVTYGQKVLAARNPESFSFIYQETIDRFQSVCFFDPEREVPDFKGIDLLYLPGGYPEKHLEALVKNEACRKAIKDYAEQGGRIVAECGGMMYLCESIINDEGEYPMCGVLPYRITARKADRKLSLGYRRFELEGQEYRGHEFHYTQFAGETPASATQVYNAKGEPVATPVFRYQNVLASYTHLYPI